ncbi:MAG TPA: rhodanese-like domain-containing protein, partial [Acidimicrobiales bacterium]|nr:rhodanese-like domain-containing protein [Acidimicrobiales bacterium]
VFTPRPWPPGAVVDADTVDHLRTSPAAVVLDARAGERYRGEVEPVDARPGHVPGARNAPWEGNLDPATGRLLPAEALRDRFTALGAGEGRTVVAYCGSGVTACHDLLALEVAGLGPGRLYPGSWSDWAAQPDRPAATGPDPAGTGDPSPVR